MQIFIEEEEMLICLARGEELLKANNSSFQEATQEWDGPVRNIPPKQPNGAQLILELGSIILIFLSKFILSLLPPHTPHPFWRNQVALDIGFEYL